MKKKAKRIAAFALAAILCLNTAAQAAPADAGKIQAVAEAAAETGTEREPKTGIGTEAETAPGTEARTEAGTEREPDTEPGTAAGTERELDTEPETAAGTEDAKEKDAEFRETQAGETDAEGKTVEGSVGTAQETEPETAEKPKAVPVKEAESGKGTVTKTIHNYSEHGTVQVYSLDGKKLASVDRENPVYDIACGGNTEGFRLVLVPDSGCSVQFLLEHTSSERDIKEMTEGKELSLSDGNSYTYQYQEGDGKTIFEAAFYEDFGFSLPKTKTARAVSRAASGYVEKERISGSATSYYSGASDKTYNNSMTMTVGSMSKKSSYLDEFVVGYTIGTADSCVSWSTCLSGHDFAAPAGRMSGSYELVIYQSSSDAKEFRCELVYTPSSAGYQRIGYAWTEIIPQDGSFYIVKRAKLNGVVLNPAKMGDSEDLDLTTTFAYFSDKACTNRLGLITTNSNGVSKSVTGLDEGTYYVSEAKAPVGFGKTSVVKTVKVEAGSSTKVVFGPDKAGGVNFARYGYITGLKLANGDTSKYPISGAVYGVYMTEEDAAYDQNAGKTSMRCVVTGTTNSKGQLYFYNDGSATAETPSQTNQVKFGQGTWYVAEITAPKGWARNDDIRTVRITPGSKDEDEDAETVAIDTTLKEGDGAGYTFSSWEQPDTGQAWVKKISSAEGVTGGNPCYSMKGITYTIYDAAKNVAATLTLDGDGKSGTVDLTVGSYTAVETSLGESTGYRLDQTPIPFTVQANVVTEIDATDAPKVANADFSVKKVAKYKGTTKSTAGAVFKVEYFMNYDCSGTAARVWRFKSTSTGNKEILSESIVKFDKDHFISDSSDAEYRDGDTCLLPLGSIRVTEETAPSGYAVSEEVLMGTIRDPGASSTSAVFTWTSGNIVGLTAEYKDDSNFAGLVLQKVDEVVYAANGSVISADSVKPQGDASLDGATFAVYNVNDYDVVTSKDTETAIPSGGEVCRIVTEGGKARTEQVETDRGTSELLMADSYYRIVEIDASTGMKVNDGFDKTIYLPDERNYVYGEKPDELLELTCPEPVKRGDVQIQKFDKELDKSEAIAGKDHGAVEDVPNLEGIEFEIRNVSKEPIYLYGDKEQKVGNEPDNNLCMVITTHWNEEKNAYTAETTGEALPYGTYTLQEVKTNDTYLLTDGEIRTFSIREDGSVVTADTDGEDLIFRNYVVREDVNFNKIAAQSSRRMQTAWVITNNVTGEAHVAVTDKNGYFDSSSQKNKHTYNTNGNDGLLVHKGTDYVIKTSEMDDKAGIWFGLGEGGTMAEANDDLRALPYGSYTLTELRCEDNEGFDLQEITFWVGGRMSNDYSDSQAVVDLGTITDYNEPEITTSAVGKETKEHFAKAGEDTVIIDTVHCTGLDKGTEYTLRASIRDYEDENASFKVNGRKVKVEKVFTAISATMDVPVEIAFDATEYTGKTGVVFEELYRGSVKVAEHTDIEDEGQRIYFPAIGTKARDSVTGGGIFSGVNEDGKAVITDTVAYVNLVPGKEYVVRGAICDKDSGKTVSDTAEQAFTPEEPDGTVELRFEFDPGEGESFVAFERLYYGEASIAGHEDPDDEDQTVRKPSVSTTAADSETGFGEAFADEEVTITDTVAYHNLKTGLEYTLKGILMDKETGEPLLADGKTVTSEVTFVPEEGDGSADVEFTFDAAGMEGKGLVVFEDLFYGETLVAAHSDLEDEGQTIRFPKIKTKAEDAKTGLDEALAEEKASITDTVLYSGLTPGKTYTVSGVLMDKKTGEPLLADGKTVTAEKEFVPEKADGSVQLSFTFSASALAGETVVAFEDLHRDGKLVAVHADINDGDQTVYFPQIGTQAMDKETGTHEGKAGKDTALVDTVAYRNLAPGTEYTVKGVLMDKASGTGLKVGGKAVTSEVTFTTPEGSGRASGTVGLEFVFDSTALAGKDTVVFERLYREGKEVAVHTDLEDGDQTVGYPELKTTAADKVTGTHEQLASGKAAIVDVVTYSGLTAGKEYVLKGTLYDKSTKKPLQVNKKTVTAEKKFIPERESGSVELEFSFDSSALAGKTVVAFEELYREKKLVGVHADIRDRDQSVRILKIGTSAKDTESGKSTVGAEKDAGITDTVKYQNLEKASCIL